MNSSELDKIMGEIDAICIPFEFVTGARVISLDGDSFTVSNEELSEIMENEMSLDEMNISNVNLIVNMEEVKNTIEEMSEIILQNIPN